MVVVEVVVDESGMTGGIGVVMTVRQLVGRVVPWSALRHLPARRHSVAGVSSLTGA